jgi:hypothetical protein
MGETMVSILQFGILFGVIAGLLILIVTSGCKSITNASLSDAQLSKRTDQNLLWTRKQLNQYPDYYAEQIERIDHELERRSNNEHINEVLE